MSRINRQRDFLKLQGQTALLTVWVNGKQNSGLINIVKESSLPFKERRPQRPETGYQRKGTSISDWNSQSGKTGLPFQVFRCSRKFSAAANQIVAFHFLSNRIFRKLFVNGKQPLSLLCPMRKHLTSLLSHQSFDACKDCRYRE